MRAWIRKLLGEPGGDGVLIPGKGTLAGVVVHVATRKRFRIVVLRARQPDTCDDCGQVCHWLSLDFQGDDDNWEPLLVVHEENLTSIQEAVADVAAFLKAPADAGRKENK